MSDNLVKLTKKDFESSQEVRWCPGCGDYSILATVQRTLASLGVRKEQHLFISGIGCASRFPYYMDTFGFHTIHGRAPSIASGVKVANPDLTVWIISGDGDALSIGGNHLMHLLRRNVNVNVLLFNNRIYGLTKGQYSPTSEKGKITKSTPMGSVDQPVNPIAFALGVGATFVARALDIDAKGLSEVLEEALRHSGTSFVEIFQNCNVFNDGSHAHMSARSVRDDRQVWLQNQEPMVFGSEKDKALDLEGLELVVKDSASAGLTKFDRSSKALAQLLAELDQQAFPVPMGVLYQEDRACYESEVVEQAHTALEKSGHELAKLLEGTDSWVI